MKEKIIITSGKKYLDIDAYASIFAYRTLLRALGYEAYAFSTAIPNESVSDLIKNLDFKFDEVNTDKNSKFVLLDVSNPKFFDTFVREKDICEIIDHHAGYEDYWQEKNINHQIEFIGSVCTLITERFFENKKENLLTPALCKILTAGILDNTLNLKSQITTSRDVEAYERLLKIGRLPNLWSEEYFSSCYEEVIENIETWTRDSIKIENVSDFLPPIFGQLIIPKKEDILNNLSSVRKVFASFDEWLLNAICLEEGVSYIIYKSKTLVNNMELLFGKIEKHDGYLVLPKCYLRKEIMKIAKNHNKN